MTSEEKWTLLAGILRALLPSDDMRKPGRQPERDKAYRTVLGLMDSLDGRVIPGPECQAPVPLMLMRGGQTEDA